VGKAVKAVLVLGLTSCAAVATSEVTMNAFGLLFPDKVVEGGNGTISTASSTRLANAEVEARVTAARDATAAADAAPKELRLQRRAVSMLAGIDRERIASIVPSPETLIDRLVALAPCPGLADAGETWVALGNDDRGAAAYVRAARQCSSPEAAVEAAIALHRLKRCDEAVAVLREAWPLIHGANSPAGIAILDGVASCSDSLTLARNLSFVPSDVLSGYYGLLDTRERDAEAQRDQAEREEEQRQVEAREQAVARSCSSECRAASSSCDSSCRGGSSCTDRCSALYHACNAGCGGY
jgi:hypothetical protein